MVWQGVVVSMSIVALGGVLGANVYNSVVDVPNWGASIPESLLATRRYFSAATPGAFFRVAAPICQLLTLVTLAACWSRGAELRLWTGSALLLSVLADVLTFAYFYPRNAVMFVQEPMADPSALTVAWQGWKTTNHARNALLLAAVACELAVLARLGGPAVG